MRQVFKALIVFGIVALLSAPAGAQQGAENKRLGVGIHLGEPLGVSARYFFFDRFAADLTTGYGFGEEGYIIQPSLLVYLRDILDYDGERFSVVPHFGVGVKTGIDLAGPNDGDAIAAVRFPLGASWIVKKGLFEISLEFAPGVEFSPETEFDPTGGIGLRYYFF